MKANIQTNIILNLDTPDVDAQPNETRLARRFIGLPPDQLTPPPPQAGGVYFCVTQTFPLTKPQTPISERLTAMVPRMEE